MEKLVQEMEFFKDTPGTFRYQVKEADGSEGITNVYIKQFAAKQNGMAVKRIRVTIEPIS